MDLWYPKADLSDKATADAGSFLGGYPKGIWHKTQGTSYSGALATYKATKNWPNMTIGYDASGKPTAWQHIAAGTAARALKNLTGGVETNRWNCFQIEIVGLADHPVPDDICAILKDVSKWLEKDFGIPRTCSVTFLPAAHSGPARMSFSAWRLYSGWCGHQHVPENDHGDPGSPFPVGQILSP